MRLVTTTVASLIGLVVVAACQLGVEPPQTFPDISFADRSPLVLDVADIRVVSVFQPSDQPPRVEQRFPVPPERALKRWAADRLRAGGTTGSARFTITDAAVVETRLDRQGGWTGLVTDQQAERYDADAVATLEVFDDHGNRLAAVETRAQRARSVAESATRDERERTWFTMTETLMAEFDREMERAVRQHLGGWLR